MVECPVGKKDVSSFGVDVDGLGESVDIFGVSLFLLKAAAATGGVDLFVT